jgi:hypothetical protein
MKTAPCLKLESWHWLKVRGWGERMSYIMLWLGRLAGLSCLALLVGYP